MQVKQNVDSNPIECQLCIEDCTSPKLSSDPYHLKITYRDCKSLFWKQNHPGNECIALAAITH